MKGLSFLPRGCPVVLGLVAVNALLWLAKGASGNVLANFGLLYGPAVQAGEFWRIITSGFLHADLIHVGFNMFLLYALGQQLEQGIGSLRFAIVYTGALLGGVLAVLMFDFDQPTLGASGAVMGIAAAFAVALHAQGNDPRKHPVFGLVLINLGLPLLVPVISFWGHLGGVVGGVLLAWLIIWRPLRSHLTPSPTAPASQFSTAAGALVLLGATCVAVARVGGLA